MKQDKSDRKIIYISLIFIVLAVMYLMPSAALEQMLPEKVVRFRIAYPVAALALMGAYLGMGWKFVLAFLFSCTGDAMGAYGSFFGQMGYFAAAHIILIWAFAEELWKGRKGVAGRITGKKRRRGGFPGLMGMENTCRTCRYRSISLRVCSCHTQSGGAMAANRMRSLCRPHHRDVRTVAYAAPASFRHRSRAIFDL